MFVYNLIKNIYTDVEEQQKSLKFITKDKAHASG